MDALQLAISVHRHTKFERPVPIEPHVPDSTQALLQHCRELEERVHRLEERIHILTAESPTRATLDLIKRTVCAEFYITEEALKSRRRDTDTSRPRQMAMYLALGQTPLSSTVIGKLLGGFDHSTVIHARKKILELRKTDHLFDKQLCSIEEKLQAMVRS